MKHHQQLFTLVCLLIALPLSALAEVKTWSFEWNKSRTTDKTAPGFYNFGSSKVDKDVYTAELNGLTWNISSDGTQVYAFTASAGQYIGSASDPSNHTSLWTESLEGKILAIRIQVRTAKTTNQATVSAKVNGQSYLTEGSEKGAFINELTEFEFKPDGDAQEGRIEFSIDPTSTSRGALYLKKIEIDYEESASSVAAPTFTPAGGTYDAPVSVTLGGAEGTTLYYTTDNSNPRLADGTRRQYTAPIAIDTTTTIKAVAVSGGETSAVATADYIIRQPAELHFFKDSISLTSGEDGYADLIDPHKVGNITYTSSNWSVCSVDEMGVLYSSYVTETQTVTITATFAGNDFYLPDTARMLVTVVARQPLKTPVVTPAGGTYNEPVQVTISTDDANAVTIWYSTTAKSAEEFEDDYTKSTIVEGHDATLTLDSTCTLYVMTLGYNVKSAVVKADFVINLPLKASFTTDKAEKTLYTQDFNTGSSTEDWTAGPGWTFSNKNFSAIDPADNQSASIGYNDGDGTSTLSTPTFDVQPNSKVEFYAYFSGIYLVWGSWQFNITDTESNTTTQLMDAFDWAQRNEYSGPNWNRFAFDLSPYTGKKVRFEFVYKFGGEDLALDNFRITQKDDAAAETIHIFEGESVEFTSTSEGHPTSLAWTFDGGTPDTSTKASQSVTYDKAGTYDVTLTASRDGESSTETRRGMVVVSARAPKALIGLPEEGYESPYVGVFVPTHVPVTFRDLSEGHPTEWNWVFQHTDKTSSTERNPQVTFLDKGTFSVGLTAKNDAGQSNDILTYAIQAGGAQYVWNIGMDENQNIEKIALGWYGNYAGTNWLGIDKFAEKYKAPLADATIDSVAVFFASGTDVSTQADIPLTINAVADNGEPGDILGSASIKASDIRADNDTVLATIFKFDKTVSIAKGTPFFIVIGPFPNQTLEVSPYASDDIAVFCVRRGTSGKTTAWQYLEDQDASGQGLGTYKWYENTDDPLSIAIAPVVTYDEATGISRPDAAGTAGHKTVAGVYTLDGRQVGTAPARGLYIVKYNDGSTRKVLKR